MDNKKDIQVISSEKIAAFLDGNVSADDLHQIVHNIGFDEELRETFEISSLVDDDLDLSGIMSETLPMAALAAHSNSQNTCVLVCELGAIKKIGIEVSEEDIVQLSQKEGWLKEGGVALHNIGRLAEHFGLIATRRYQCTIDDLQKGLDYGILPIVAVDGGELRGNLIQEAIEDMYVGRIPDHTLLVTDIDDKGIHVYDPAPFVGDIIYDRQAFRRAWDDSNFYAVFISKTGTLPYTPHPIELSDVYLDGSLNELQEAIAENAHEIWALQRQKEGWTYGPTRNDELKQTPDMVPYSQLPESEKLYDRETAMNTIKLLKKLGYDIVRRNRHL